MRKIFIFTVLLLSLVVINCHAGTISFDQLAVSSDLTASKYNGDLNTVFQKVNKAIQTDNIEDDTLLEADMADEINPRIRTYEGASCEFVYTGLLPSTTSGTLTGSVPAGTAYPLGYRVRKDSATPKTFTASKWTYIDLDINGNFTYPETTINASAPAITANSIRIARVSTDSTEVNTVTDLRTTSCTSGPFGAISDTSTGASLGDLLTYGSPIKSDGTAGFLQGLHISYDTHTTFVVKPGSAYINGKYRTQKTTETITSGADDPANGISGIETGSLAASTAYNVYAVADQDSVSDMSFTFSTSTTPSGLTNYRKIGSFKTDGSALITSSDIIQTNNINQKELIASMVRFDGSATPITIASSYNVAGITDSGTGSYVVNFAFPFTNTKYANVVTASYPPGSTPAGVTSSSYAVGSYSFDIEYGGSNVDSPNVNVLNVGEKLNK